MTMNDGTKAILVISRGILYVVPEWKYLRGNIDTYPEALARLFSKGYVRIASQWTIEGYYNFCFSIDNRMSNDVVAKSWRSLINEVNNLKL